MQSGIKSGDFTVIKNMSYERDTDLAVLFWEGTGTNLKILFIYSNILLTFF